MKTSADFNIGERVIVVGVPKEDETFGITGIYAGKADMENYIAIIILDYPREDALAITFPFPCLEKVTFLDKKVI